MKSKPFLKTGLARSASLALMAGALFALTLQAQAALTHRYSFTSDASDSVAGANVVFTK